MPVATASKIERAVDYGFRTKVEIADELRVARDDAELASLLAEMEDDGRLIVWEDDEDPNYHLPPHGYVALR